MKNINIKNSTILTNENRKLYNELKPLHSFYFNENLDFEFRSKLNIPGMYRILNTKNGVFYLGVASNLMSRFSSHRNHANIKSHENELLQDDINIYGIENFKFEVLKMANSLKEYNAILQEESKILFYCRKVNIHVYNITIQPFKEIKNDTNIRKLTLKNEAMRRFSREWIIIYPDNREERITNLREYCRQHSLDHKPLIEVADGLRDSYKNLKCKRGKGNKRIRKPRPHLRGKCSATSKKYLVTFPDGEEVEIIGLSEFCREHKLGLTIMCAIANNKADQYKHHGFTIKKL